MGFWSNDADDVAIMMGEMATKAKAEVASKSGYDSSEFDRLYTKAKRLAEKVHPKYKFDWSDE